MLTAFASFALFALLVTVVPGPDTLLVPRNCGSQEAVALSRPA